jgi:hypothetical protein
MIPPGAGAAVVEVAVLEQALNATKNKAKITIPNILFFTSNPPTLFHILSFERYLQYNAPKPAKLLTRVSFSQASS